MAVKQNFCRMVFLFLHTIFFFSANVASITEGYTACAPFSCDNFFNYNISYPFFNSNQPDYCGHPAFKLTCLKDMVTMEIKSQKFRVLDISHDLKTFKIESLDILGLNGACPKHSANITLDLAVFSYTSRDDNYTLLFDCGPLPSSLNYVPFKLFKCVGDGYHHKGYFISTKNLANFANVGCKNNITVPALEKASNHYITCITCNLSMESVLAIGLEVEVKHSGVDGDRCDGCIISGGRCGYNATINASTCFCLKEQYGGVCSKEQSHPTTSSNWNWKWKTILCVVSGLLGALVVITGIYFYQRRMQSQSLLSQDLDRGSNRFGVHHFSYAELEQATNNFERELGDGASGTVYFGTLQDGRSVAVKRLCEHNHFQNEIQILTGLVHPNLVSLYGCTSHNSRELLLVYEYIPNGTVAEHLHGSRANPGLSWSSRMSIAVETASALKYLHASEVVHRDVKTNNILLDNHFHVKLADFGLSRLFPDDASHILTAPQGTPGYVDPEYNQSYRLTSRSDVFSFGVVLIELISSLPAFEWGREQINLANIAINKIHNNALHELVHPSLGFQSYTNVTNMINGVAELAYRCLQSSGNMRPSMDEVLSTLQNIQSDGNQHDVMDMSSSHDDNIVLMNDDPSSSTFSIAIS